MFTFNNAWGVARRVLFPAVCVATMAMPQAWAQETATTLRAVPSALLSIDQNRGTVVDRIVAEWGEAFTQASAGMTVEQLRETLSAMRSDYLLAASLAGSLDGLRNVLSSSLIGAAPPAAAKPRNVKALGDAGDDLVYTPVVPCRLTDSRVAGGGGPIPGNSSRSYRVWVSAGGFTFQGGSATNCNIPANPAAVALNVTAVAPSGAGNLIAYPFNTGQPLSSVVNYQGGQAAIANGAIVPACVPDCASQVTITTNGAGTDVVVDIVGYFAAPIATALQCTTVAGAPTQIATSADQQVALPGCAAGYTRTGSACSGTEGIPSAYVIGTMATACIFRNLSSVATYNGTATSICCRVPGR